MGKEIERAERLADELSRLYGDELVSVVLYGSAARGQFHDGVSDLNVLVLLRDAGPAALRRATKTARQWVEDGNLPPLVFGAEEWRRSADVFPIELADIREANRVLHGANPFEGLEIERGDLRLQCENELKGKQVQLRERYLLLSDRPEELGKVMKRSLSTFLVLFRTVLRLVGETPPHDPEATIRRTAERVGFDPEPVLAILRSRRSGEALKPGAEAPEVTGYLEAVARTAEFVDRLPE
jgi:predicted nucleotidyltransferase